MNKNLSYLIPLLLAGTTHPLLAQEKDALDEIIVTSTREGKVIQDVDSNIIVVTAKAIDNTQAQNLTDVFKYEPGINFESDSRIGGRDIRIRGIGDGRVLVRIDGLALPDAYEFGPFLRSGRQRFDVANIKQAEIIRGPSSSLYGSRVIGGVVNFTTKDPEDYLTQGKQFGGNFSIGYSGINEAKHLGSTVAGQFSASLSAMLAVTHRNYHESKIHSGLGGIGATREKNNPEDNTSTDVLAKVVFEPSADNRFTLTGTAYRQDVDADILSAKNVTRFGTLTQNHRGEDKKDRKALILKHDFNASSALIDSGYWRLSYQKNDAKNYNELIRSARGTDYTEHKNDNYQSDSVAFETQLSKQFDTASVSHELVYGFSYSQQDLETLRENKRVSNGTAVVTAESNFPKSSVTELGIFVQNRMIMGNWELIPGLRYDRYKLDADPSETYLNASNNVEPQDFDENRVSFRLGTLYHLSQSNSLFANYSQGFRAPAFNDANVGFTNAARGYSFLPNPDLKPETSEGVELGWRTNTEMGYSSLSAFYTEYDDFIEQTSTFNPVTKFVSFQNINLDKTKIYGLEFSGELDLQHALNAPQGLKLKGSFAYAKGKDKTSGEPLNSISPFSAVLGLAYDSPAKTWGAEGLVRVNAKKSNSDISKQKLDDNITGSAGYATLDLMAYYRLNKSAKINVGVFNAFDKKHITWETAQNISTASRGNSDTESGRYFAATFSYDF